MKWLRRFYDGMCFGAQAYAQWDISTSRRILGERRRLVISDTEKKMTSYHEAGHALVAHLQPGSDRAHKVTIIPRGRALGVVAQLVKHPPDHHR